MHNLPQKRVVVLNRTSPKEVSTEGSTQ